MWLSRAEPDPLSRTKLMQALLPSDRRMLSSFEVNDLPAVVKCLPCQRVLSSYPSPHSRFLSSCNENAPTQCSPLHEIRRLQSFASRESNLSFLDGQARIPQQQLRCHRLPSRGWSQLLPSPSPSPRKKKSKRKKPKGPSTRHWNPVRSLINGGLSREVRHSLPVDSEKNVDGAQCRIVLAALQVRV